MTAEDVAAVVAGVAPVVLDHVKTATQRLELEISTLREALLVLREQVHADAALRAALEARLLEQQKSAFEARCADLEARLLDRAAPRVVPHALTR